jgi:SagB-type dehydrogenase family enzyme
MAGEISPPDSQIPRPGRRTAPSAGGLYPLDFFVFANRVEGLPVGTYSFDPSSYTLSLLRASVRREELDEAYFASWLAEAAVGVFLSAVFARSRFKYGLRGYRLVLLEAGHIIQNALLAASAIGLQARPVGGFFDRALNRLFDLDGVNEAIVYAIVAGRTGAGDESPG